MPKVTVISVPRELVKEIDNFSLLRKGLTFCNKGVMALQRQLTLQQSRVGEILFQGIVAFLLSRIVILGELDACGIAFYGALAHRFAPGRFLAAVGVVLGALSLGRWEAACAYGVAMAIYHHYGLKKKGVATWFFWQMLFWFTLLIASKLSLLFFSTFSLYDVMLAFLNGLFGFLLYYVFTIALGESGDFFQAQIAKEVLLAKLVLVSLALSGIGATVVYGWELRHILGSFFVLMLAFSGGAGIGAVVGLCTGMILGFVSEDALSFMMLFAMAGMLGGAVRQNGKYASALAYLMGFCLVLLLLGQGVSPSWLAEGAISCGAFLFCPLKYISLTSRLVGPEKKTDYAVKAASSQKLAELAALFSDLGQAMGSREGQKQADVEEYEAQLLLVEVGQQVCECCTKREECWGSAFYQSYEALIILAGRAEQGNKTISRYFKDICLKPEELMTQVLKVTEEKLARSYWQLQLNETRHLACEQMLALSDILQNLRQELVKKPRQDTALATRLQEEAAALACPLQFATAFCESQAKVLQIEKAPCSKNQECRHTLLPLAESLTGDVLEMATECGSAEKGSLCEITFKTAAKMMLQVGYACAAQQPGAELGDTCSYLSLAEGKFIMILSDGMGTGSEAAQESTKAVKFLERLLKAGFSVETAVKTVNALLIAQKSGESFPTLDLAVINAYSGETDFIKIGAAPSYVKRVKEVMTIEYCSAPAGIVPQRLEPVSVQLTVGDLVVLVSDGVSDSGKTERGNWLANYLRCLSSEEPQQIAEALLQEAQRRSCSKAVDDMTVLVGRLNKVNR
ncbi:MAG: stage II sporulation protein E [Sporomusaceae bacterium]|nr:stage II sporulation protein E [Sporomusaceae bacterium]